MDTNMKITKRYLNEMAEMYGLPNELYTMKRGIKFKGKLRYDITEIPGVIINGHYNRTKGHIHTTGHDELYIVLQGEAIFQFQNKKGETWHTRGFKGSKITIPGDAYHVTINPTKKLLRMANWIHKDCVSSYTYLEKKKGMKYYYTTNGWIKNENYK